MMSRDKHIEEMAKIICAPTANKGNCDKCGFKRHCSKFDDATDLYTAGYRKAFDLVNEIFADVFKAIRKYYIEAEHTKSVTCELMLDYLKGDLAELKKKYTEGKAEIPPYVRMEAKALPATLNVKYTEEGK